LAFNKHLNEMNWSTHPTPIHLLFLKLNMDANLGWIKKKKEEEDNNNWASLACSGMSP